MIEVCVCQDGTVKLWEYDSGRRLQSWDLQEETPGPEDNDEKVTAGCLILQHRNERNTPWF